MSLNTQTNKISGVLNFPMNIKTPKEINSFIDLFKSYCISVSEEFYIILHNRDLTSNGELKTPHLHFLICIDTNKGVSDRKRLSTHLLDISNYMNLPTNLISLECWKNYDLGIQYLIHKNNPDKVSYSPTEIISNKTFDFIEIILNKEYADTISIDYIIELCSNCSTKTEIYKKLGLKDAKTYRYLINDIFADLHKKAY